MAASRPFTSKIYKMAAEGGHFVDVLLLRQSEFDWRQIRTVLDTPAGLENISTSRPSASKWKNFFSNHFLNLDNLGKMQF